MKKYKIAVLSNLDGKMHTTLKSAVGLAKIIDGEIEVFSVKKASEIVDSDNQLSAMRSINQQHKSLRKKIEHIINPISEQYDIRIDYSFSVGNVKGEIGQYIETKKPDIIVLGKRKQKMLNLIGDKITPFVLSKFKGAIMIADEKNVIEPNKEISLGMLNNLEPNFNLEFAEDLIEHTQKPLKSFNIAQSSSTKEAPKVPSNKKVVEYVFEKGDGAIESISNYLVKNKIDVLYIDRSKKPNNKKTNTLSPVTDDIINKLNVTLLVTGDKNFDLQ